MSSVRQAYKRSGICIFAAQMDGQIELAPLSKLRHPAVPALILTPMRLWLQYKIILELFLHLMMHSKHAVHRYYIASMRQARELLHTWHFSSSLLISELQITTLNLTSLNSLHKSSTTKLELLILEVVFEFSVSKL